MAEYPDKEKKLDNNQQQLRKSREANWPAVLFFIHVHLLSVYGLWLLFNDAMWMTILFLFAITSVAILGMTTGAHRLWAHRTYKASTGLRFTLMIFQTLAGVGPIYNWVHNHRLHHATFATTDDPCDYNKGFLYAQLITRFRKLSPYQEKLKESIDMSDLETDSIVMFQKRLYWLQYVVMFLLLPLNAPMEYWDESVLNTIFIIGFLRYFIILHFTWLIESSICIWGLKPGEKSPPDTNAVFIVNKTFWPHYHYLIPYDYKCGEYGTYDSGCSTAFIRVWAALRMATDLRTVETNTIQLALTHAVKGNRSVESSLQEMINKQILPEDHFLQGK